MKWENRGVHFETTPDGKGRRLVIDGRWVVGDGAEDKKDAQKEEKALEKMVLAELGKLAKG